MSYENAINKFENRVNTKINTMKTLNADNRIYLVSFAWRATNGKFITTDLGQCIKDNDQGRGIDYIKALDPIKNSFKRISKKDILSFESWNTETVEILTKHSYFK